MAMRFNAVTGKFEEDGLVRPLTGAPIDTAPDDVSPDDLVVGADPRKPYAGVIPISGRSVPAGPAAPTPPGQGDAGMMPISDRPADNPLHASAEPVNYANQVAPFPVQEDQPPGEPAAPAPSQPAIRRGGAGQGGAGAAGPPQGGHLTADEAIAQGGQETAAEGLEGAIQGGTNVEVRKNEALARQADEQAKQTEQMQKAWQTKRAEAEKHLAEREEAASKMKVKDIFEGRPLAALVSALASGIGARSAAITGTENTALRVTNEAAAAFRERQEATYQREMSGIKNENDRLQFATMQATADEAGLYRRFEMDRTKLLQTYGADEARVKGDTMLAKFREERVDKKAQIATMLHERGRTEVLDAAKIAEMRSQSAQNYASAAKLKAEAAGGGAQKGDRAAAHKIDLGIYGASVLDQIQEAEALKLSDKEIAAALAKVQSNETYMESGKHSGVAGTLIGRGVGVIPKGRLEGLNERQQKYINNLDVASKKVATVLAGQGRANSHEMMERLTPQPSDSPAVIRQKLMEMRAVAQEAKDEASQYGDIAAESIRRAKEGGPPVAQPPPSKSERAEAVAWANKHPEDPRAARIRAAARGN